MWPHFPDTVWFTTEMLLLLMHLFRSYGLTVTMHSVVQLCLPEATLNLRDVTLVSKMLYVINLKQHSAALTYKRPPVLQPWKWILLCEGSRWVSHCFCANCTVSKLPDSRTAAKRPQRVHSSGQEINKATECGKPNNRPRLKSHRAQRGNGLRIRPHPQSLLLCKTYTLIKHMNSLSLT